MCVFLGAQPPKEYSDTLPVLVPGNQPLNVFVADEKESVRKPSGVALYIRICVFVCVCVRGIDMQIKINKIIYVSLNLN